MRRDLDEYDWARTTPTGQAVGLAIWGLACFAAGFLLALILL